ncbi:FAD binding domain-containing protein [Fusarium coicis]|nr:FAD binding domain-containing protein [Fusarium coicis]
MGGAGYDTRTLDRQVFLLYEKARVEEIIEENSVAHVILADGREFVDDVVVGSDGVHSKVREIMWDKANALQPGMITVDEKRAMITQYNAIVMASSPVPGIGAHDMEITSNDKYSPLLLCQPEWISIIVHSKLPEDQQCTWPTRRRYTEADMEVLVSKISERPVTDTVVFGELWKRRLKAQMISLEEGVLEHWTFGRIVLAGDAVQKVTPNSALGGNTAMEEAVVITNTLHVLLARHPQKKKPSDVELHDVMRQEYQNTRIERARTIVKAGGALTRQQAYDGWKAYITQRWLTPIIGLDTLAQKIAGLCVKAPKLSFVEFEEKRGILGWQDTMDAEKKSHHPSGYRSWFELLSPKLSFLIRRTSAHETEGSGRHEKGPDALHSTCDLWSNNSFFVFRKSFERSAARAGNQVANLSFRGARQSVAYFVDGDVVEKAATDSKKKHHAEILG